MAPLTIGQVADRTGLATSTLRYYESRGLVEPAARTAAGYRLYDERSLARLGFVARAKELGCTLAEIGELLALWEAEACGPVQAHLHGLVTDKIAAARQRTADLAELTAQLRQAAAKLDAPPTDGPCGPTCACADAAIDDPEGPAPIELGSRPSVASCTLPADRVDERLAAWRSALVEVSRREATDDGGFRLVLGTTTPLAEVARLAQAEQGCCAFFSFAITVDQRGTALEVRAPEEGASVLATVFGSAPGGTEPKPAQIT